MLTVLSLLMWRCHLRPPRAPLLWAATVLRRGVCAGAVAKYFECHPVGRLGRASRGGKGLLEVQTRPGSEQRLGRAGGAGGRPLCGEDRGVQRPCGGTQHAGLGTAVTGCGGTQAGRKGRSPVTQGAVRRSEGGVSLDDLWDPVPFLSVCIYLRPALSQEGFTFPAHS